jgi:YidC/Oxa1 family membrane protein insertase
MPIWIALYSMLFYAIELRHEPAFWGIFQAVSDGRWAFLSDLSSPDRFMRFSDQPLRVNFPLLNVMDFSAFNILPILMGVAMFFQQRLMAQPAANEQQQQMQRMMSFMLLIFPVFLYAAPSGLNLYILASTGAGMLDSYLVRRHIRREEEAGTFLNGKGPKPGGLGERMGKWAAARQAEIEAKRQRLEGGQGQHRYRDRKDNRKDKR